MKSAEETVTSDAVVMLLVTLCGRFGIEGHG
jgi:hypothetical protein